MNGFLALNFYYITFSDYIIFSDENVKMKIFKDVTESQIKTGKLEFSELETLKIHAISSNPLKSTKN